MANPLFGKALDANGHHVIWDEGFGSHELLARITPFLFPRYSGFMDDTLSEEDCKLIGRLVRNWAGLQGIWNESKYINQNFFRQGNTVFMPPFIKLLDENADKIEEVIPGIKDQIRDIYLMLNQSTADIEEDNPKEIIESMLKVAEWFEASGGLVSEEQANDDDFKTDFLLFIKENNKVFHGKDEMIEAFLDMMQKKGWADEELVDIWREDAEKLVPFHYREVLGWY